MFPDRQEKTGRNDFCPCGSGEKYKKCCLPGDDVSASSSWQNKRKRGDGKKSPLMVTTTKEPLMPIRLYYDVFDKKRFLQRLSQLECVRLESEDQFLITYEKEAQRLPLAVPYDQVPEDVYPVLLAFGRFVDETHIQLDLRSFERGLGMIEFLDQEIDRSLAQITHIASYNKVSTKADFKDITLLEFDKFFSEDTLTIRDPEEALQRLEAALEKEDDQDEKQKIVEHHFHDMAQHDLPLIEKYPIYYYDEGIESVRTTLMLRAIVALEHWRGNTACKPLDVVQRVFNQT